MALAESGEHSAWDGITATAVCLRAATLYADCPVMVEGEGTFTVLPEDALRVSGELTYVPRAATTQLMHVYVQGYAAAGGPPVSWVEFRGSGRIPFQADLAGMAGDWFALNVHGDFRSLERPQATLVYEVAQEFHVEMDLVR